MIGSYVFPIKADLGKIAAHPAEGGLYFFTIYPSVSYNHQESVGFSVTFLLTRQEEKFIKRIKSLINIQTVVSSLYLSWKPYLIPCIANYTVHELLHLLNSSSEVIQTFIEESCLIKRLGNCTTY